MIFPFFYFKVRLILSITHLAFNINAKRLIYRMVNVWMNLLLNNTNVQKYFRRLRTSLDLLNHDFKTQTVLTKPWTVWYGSHNWINLWLHNRKKTLIDSVLNFLQWRISLDLLKMKPLWYFLIRFIHHETRTMPLKKLL